MNANISLTVPARAEFVDIIRLTLYGIADKAGFSYEEIEDMKVAVTEACTNVVLHAYSNREPGSIDVKFNQSDEGLTISIKDAGSSFTYEHGNHKQVSLHNKELNEITAGGLGIFLMHALMDRVEVMTEKGTEVILTKLSGRKEEMA
jgi:serine/threonine-protein kinase RsbW